jgi:hypothetical protein
MSLFKSNITQAATQALASVIVPPTPLIIIPGLGADNVLAASKALAAIAHPQGMLRPFLPHQAAAYLYARDSIARWGCSLIGDDMGMGKTQVLLALVADSVANGGYAVMVAPPVCKAGYQADLQAAFPALRFHHLYGRKADFANLPTADIYFISDDALTMKAWLVESAPAKQLPVINAFAAGATIVVRDEIHRDKGNEDKPSARAKVMLALGAAMRANNRPIIGATGTILTNKPVEAFTPLQILGGEALVKAITPGGKSVRSFLYRYCGAADNGYGWSYKGVDMDRMGELHEYLRRTVYVRREKGDLGEALPHSGWIIKPIALNGVLDRYQALEDDFRGVVLQEKGPEAMWRAARAEAMNRMMAMWQEAGRAKAQVTVEYVKDLVDQGRKVVLFYYHKSVQEALIVGLLKAKIELTVIDGSITGQAREDAIEDFQNGTPSVLVAQIKAAGVGVTLTAAADAVFVQVPWSAGDLKQAADRILRVDDRTRQRAIDGEAITWHVLQAAKANGDATFDMAIWDVLERKAMVCDAVNAGQPVTMSDESIMRQALDQWFANGS